MTPQEIKHARFLKAIKREEHRDRMIDRRREQLKREPTFRGGYAGDIAQLKSARERFAAYWRNVYATHGYSKAMRKQRELTIA